LTSAELGALTTTQIGGLTADQVGALTTTQLAGLSSTELGIHTGTQISGLRTTQLALLDITTQLNGLTSTQTGAIKRKPNRRVDVSETSCADNDADWRPQRTAIVLTTT
jgi:hypothetical protein